MKPQNGQQIDIQVKNEGYKRPFDLGILMFSHVLLLPIWLLLWTAIPIAIWLADKGPVFYAQRRTGKHGQVFTVYKFRTMIPNADRKGPAWTIPGDPRMTLVGKVLRRTALDELPELWSILKGDMSFVGPRPLDEKEQKQLEDEIPGFHRRLSVRPGLTGLAQVYDPADLALDKFKHDLDYLGCLSPWLDAKLILMSVFNSFGARWDHRSGKPQASQDETPTSDQDPQQVEIVGKDEPIYRH